jgi:hypothetical protein
MCLAVNVIRVGLVTLIVAVAVIAITWMLKRRRRDVWRELARRRGLAFGDGDDGPRLSGQFAERTVEVSIDDFSSDRDLGGVEVVRIAVELERVPGGLTAEGIPGLIGDLSALGEQRIEFEPVPFQQNVLVQGDEGPARAYWTAARQDAFVRLVDTLPCDQIELRDGRVIAELREIVSDRRRLEQIIDGLVNSASTLDGASDGGDE